MYADIALDVPKAMNSETFTYSVPKKFESEPLLGKKAVVPFGKGKRSGIITGLKDTYDGTYTIKSIIQISTKPALIDESHIRLALWMSDYYHTSVYRTLKLFIPESVLNDTVKLPVKWFITLVPGFDIESVKKAKRQYEFLKKISEFKGAKKILEDIDPEIPKQTVRALEKKGAITIEETVVFSSPTFSMEKVGRRREFNLTEEQNHIIKTIEDNKFHAPYLIHGITGSGKTEIYMAVISEMLNQGKGAIVLVPEIALTPQTIQRFRNKFPDILAVWHHRLSDTEKFYEWMRMQNGEAKVLIGSRSALFQPIQNLGAIIIDEEHETSYKQDQEPRYHARDAAERLAEYTEARLILGDATPNVVSYYQAKQNKYHLFVLKNRFSTDGLPPVTVVDMRKELRDRNYSMFSKQLQFELTRTLEQKNQAILFINRRGAASVLLCRNCGWKSKCPRCDIVLTMHREGEVVGKEKLLCHYCNYSIPVPVKCPECGSAYIKPIGGGTQKVMQELAFMFPHARLIRADRDTTTTKNALASIYNAFKNHEADILIGTQMIAKGWDIPNVRLVGIVMADIGINMPDYLAEERIFSVLTQVAGRAGRDKIPGVVIMQTYSPDNPLFDYVQKHDYEGFYNYEILKRQSFKYPPYIHLAKIEFVHTNQLLAQRSMESLKETALKVIQEKKLAIELLGPAPNIFPKIYHKYHFHLLLKTEQIAHIHILLRQLELGEYRVDIDPLGF